MKVNDVQDSGSQSNVLITR